MITHSVYSRDVRIRRYAEYLAKEGFLVDIVCLSSETEDYREPYPGVRVFPIPWTKNRKEGLLQTMEWLVAVFMMFLYTSFLDIKYRYDLVHVHNLPDFIVFAALIPKMRGCPILFNVHDPSPEIARSKLELSENHPLIRVVAFIERISLRFSDHIITASSSFKKKLVERGTPAEKITVIMNAADGRFFKIDSDGEKTDRSTNGRFTMLYVGTVATRYGLDITIRALPKLKSKIDGLCLKVFPKIKGEGKALDNCVSLARKLDVGELVEVLDPVPLEQMPEVMKNADLGIYPARRDCHMDIALSLKIPEMVNMKLPIVASKLSILEELYGDDGIAYFADGNPDAFAEKVLELYYDRGMMRKIAENALRHSASFTWESQYLIYRKTIDGLLRQPRKCRGESVAK